MSAQSFAGDVLRKFDLLKPLIEVSNADRSPPPPAKDEIDSFCERGGGGGDSGPSIDFNCKCYEDKNKL